MESLFPNFKVKFGTIVVVLPVGAGFLRENARRRVPASP